MTISVRKHLHSSTLDVPELAPMIGKDVRIIVVEENAAEVSPPDLSALHHLAGRIDLDDQAIHDLRAWSMV